MARIFIPKKMLYSPIYAIIYLYLIYFNKLKRMVKVNINTKDLTEFEQIIREFENDENIQEMIKYRHHYETNCYEHCKHVAYYTYILCKKFNLDYISGVKAAMLHDLFLYDWRIKSDRCPRLHGFRHPRIALENSKKLFALTCKEEDMILKHMWPLTISLPKYKESYILCLADKIATYIETREHYRGIIKSRRIFRYSYVFLCLLVFKIF